MADNFVAPPIPQQLLDALKRKYAPNDAMSMGAPSPLMQPGFPGGPPATAGSMPLAGRMPPPAPSAVPPAPPATAGMMPLAGRTAPPSPSAVPPATASDAAARERTGAHLDAAGRAVLDMMPLAGRMAPSGPSAVPPSPPATAGNPGVTPNANGMGQMPKQQDLGSYLNPALKQYQADQAGYQQADEANRIDPQQVKPRLWERLAGFALGATQLKDPQNAGAVAGEVVNRRRAGAEQARSTALAPWTQRLQQDKEGLPLAEASARTGYEQGELDLRRAAEERDRFTAVQNADNKQALLDVREEVAQGNIEKAANLLDQKQKELELKKTHDSEWFAMQHAILDLRSRMEDRKAEKAKEGKDHTAQAVGAETAKANALTAAEDKYRKARTVIDTDHPPDDKGQESAEHKEAMAALNDELITDKQRAQDAYSAKSAELGGSGEHQDVASWKGSKAAPAATGATNTKPAAPTSNAQPGTGKILPMSAIEQAAKDNNTSVEEATRQAKLQGYQVQ